MGSLVEDHREVQEVLATLVLRPLNSASSFDEVGILGEQISDVEVWFGHRSEVWRHA